MGRVLLFFSLVVLCHSSHADDLADASNAMCAKMQQCITQQLNQPGTEMSPQMRQMVESMTAQMCDNLLDTSQVSSYHDLYQPAVDCMNSMSKLSCDALQDDPQTPQCTIYQELAEAYQ